MKRLSLLTGLLIVMGLLVTACQPKGPETIKIGLNAELTGGVPVVGALLQERGRTGSGGDQQRRRAGGRREEVQD
jgi:hypothetical protein